MLSVILILIECILLYILSRKSVQGLYTMLVLVTGNNSISIAVITLLLFPGTVIHELSHLFTAEILGVRTGKLELSPEWIRGKPIPGTRQEVTAGSVMIAKTGPFRRAAIGLAPFLVGLIATIALAWYVPVLYGQVPWKDGIPVLLHPASVGLVFALYGIGSVSSSMFSSSEDMKGVWPVLILLVLVIGALYLSGVRFNLTGHINTTFYSIIKYLTIILAGIIGLHAGVIGISGILLRLFYHKKYRIV